MRKFSFYLIGLSIIATAVTMAGCKKQPERPFSPICAHYIVNDTATEMVVDVKDMRTNEVLTSTVIPVGSKKGIYKFSPDVPTMDPHIETRNVSYDLRFDYGVDMVINGELVNHFIWKWEYWKLNFIERGSDDAVNTHAYTLTVNDELWEKFGPYTVNYVFKNNTSAEYIVVGPWWQYFYEYPGETNYRTCSWSSNGIGVFRDGVDVGYELTEPIFSTTLDRRFSEPLYWERSNSRDSIFVTMGNKRVIHYRSSNDPLYRNETYTLVSEDKYNRTYEFTFTDEFFENAETIE